MFEWQAWLYCAAILACVAAVGIYFLRNNREFLLRRFEYREKEASQKKIVAWTAIPYVFVYIAPGLDKRFGWSNVPPEHSLAALAIVLLGYWIIFLSFKENAYAARTIRVEKHQTTISTGPYAVVRHPMYLGVLLMLLATPVALGSYWATLAFLPLPYLLSLRATDEERILKRDLKGYQQYCRKVKWRILPGIW